MKTYEASKKIYSFQNQLNGILNDLETRHRTRAINKIYSLSDRLIEIGYCLDNSEEVEGREW